MRTNGDWEILCAGMQIKNISKADQLRYELAWAELELAKLKRAYEVESMCSQPKK